MADKNAFTALTNMNAAASRSSELTGQINQAMKEFLVNLDKYMKATGAAPAVVTGYEEASKKGNKSNNSNKR